MTHSAISSVGLFLKDQTVVVVSRKVVYLSTGLMMNIGSLGLDGLEDVRYTKAGDTRSLISPWWGPDSNSAPHCSVNQDLNH